MSREVNVRFTTESETTPIGEDIFATIDNDGNVAITDKTETTEILTEVPGDEKTYMTVTDKYSKMSIEQLRDTLRKRDRLEEISEELQHIDLSKYIDLSKIYSTIRSKKPIDKEVLELLETELQLLKEYYSLTSGEEIV